MLRPTIVAGVAGILIGIGSASAADYAGRAAALLAKGEPRAAAIELRNAVKQDPGDAAAHFELAKIDLWLGDAVAAEREARAAQAHGYDPGKSLSLLLETYLAQGRYKDLLHDFPAGNSNPELASRIALGRAHAELGLNQINQAAAEIATAHRLSPTEVGPLLAAEDLDLAKRDLAAARASLSAAKAIEPHDPDVLRREAALLLATGKVKDAVAVLESVKAMAPGDPTVRLQLVNALLAAGQPARADQELKVALKMVPGSVEGIYLQALFLSNRGDYTGAYQLLQKLSPVIERVPQAYLLEAVTLEHLGQWSAARNAATQFAGHFPNDPRGKRVLAAIALNAGQPAAALTTLEALPPDQRSDPESLELLARAHAETSDRAAAAKEFAAVAKLEPNLAAPHAGLAALALQEGKVSEAIAEYQKALALAPDDKATRRALIAVAISTGQYQLAESNLEILKKAEPASVPDGLLSAQLQLARLDFAGAKTIYSRLLKTDPHTTEALIGLAHIAALEGDQKAERAHLDAVLAQDPTNGAALASLTALLGSEGKVEDARKMLEHAHSVAPGNAAITADLAVWDLRTKQAQKALDLLAGADAASNPELLGLQAEAELTLGRKEAATNTLQTILARVPGAVNVRLTLARLLVSGKDYDGARAVLQQGLVVHPGTLALLQGLVGVALAEHGADAALAEAKRLAADPTQLPAGRVLPGDFAMSQHQPAVAAKAYAAALSTEPSVALALRLSGALQAAGKPDQAADGLRTYLARHGDAIPVLLTLASIEIGQGQLEPAAKRLEAVIERQPNNAIALNNLAWILSQEGKPGALELAERAYFLAPDPHTAD
ncbi:MAG: XrtA/PEP-CTERM system TPR-repeat protein PrsT, partial [Acetobacteraceae bacterium]